MLPNNIHTQQQHQDANLMLTYHLGLSTTMFYNTAIARKLLTVDNLNFNILRSLPQGQRSQNIGSREYSRKACFFCWTLGHRLSSFSTHFLKKASTLGTLDMLLSILWINPEQGPYESYLGFCEYLQGTALGTWDVSIVPMTRLAVAPRHSSSRSSYLLIKS